MISTLARRGKNVSSLTPRSHVRDSWFPKNSNEVNNLKLQEKIGVKIAKVVRRLRKNPARIEGQDKPYRAIPIQTGLVIEHNGMVQGINGDNVFVSLKINEMNECDLTLPKSAFQEGQFIKAGDLIRYKILRASHNQLTQVIERVLPPKLSPAIEKEIDEEIRQFLVEIGEVNDT